jgi:hypothetical protein
MHLLGSHGQSVLMFVCGDRYKEARHSLGEDSLRENYVAPRTRVRGAARPARSVRHFAGPAGRRWHRRSKAEEKGARRAKRRLLLGASAGTFEDGRQRRLRLSGRVAVAARSEGRCQAGAVFAASFYACKAGGMPIDVLGARAGDGGAVEIDKSRLQADGEFRRGRPVRPGDILPRCCERGMVGRDVAATKSLLLECRQLCADLNGVVALQGRTPASLAVAATWSVAKRRGLSLSKKQISLGCEVSVATLDRCLVILEGAAGAPPSGSA